MGSRTFAWLERCRSERKREPVFRLAKDFEWTVASSLAWVNLAVSWFLRRQVIRSLYNRKYPEILSVMTCGIGSDIAKATFFVAFPNSLTASNVGRIRDVVPLDQQVRGNQGKADKLPIVGPSSIPILG